jgi:hypothetical protein
MLLRIPRVRLFIYSLLLLGLLAGVGVVYFRHETQAAEQTLNLEQPNTQSRAQPVSHFTLSRR